MRTAGLQQLICSNREIVKAGVRLSVGEHIGKWQRGAELNPKK